MFYPLHPQTSNGRTLIINKYQIYSPQKTIVKLLEIYIPVKKEEQMYIRHGHRKT